jgi:hypothetical protein
VQPKKFLTSVTANGGSWTATLDVGNFGLAGPTVFSVTATDADDNTSEFAVPVAIFVSGQ